MFKYCDDFCCFHYNNPYLYPLLSSQFSSSQESNHTIDDNTENYAPFAINRFDDSFNTPLFPYIKYDNSL